MKIRRRFNPFGVIASLLLLVSSTLSATEIYTVPAGERRHDGYTVTVGGVTVPVSEVRVSAMPFNRRWPGHQRQIDQTELAGMVRFAFTGKAQVSVVSKKDFKSVKVRPLSRKVCPSADGRTVTFDLTEPGGYSVEFDGYHGNLHVFADAPKSYGITEKSPQTRYFGPGEHDVGIVRLKDREKVYIDSGAVVYGMFHASNCTDVAILGRGILDASRIKEKILFPASGDGKADCHNAVRWHTIHLVNCRRIRVDGLTLRDSLCYNIGLWGCEDIDIENVKIVGQWRYNTDGIDLHNCRRGRIRDCFARCFDDVFCVKAHAFPGGDCEDLTFERCVAWADWGKAFEVGVECQADVMKGLRFVDCDCVRSCGGVMDVDNVDWGFVSDVSFERIRIETDDPLPRKRIQKDDADKFEDGSEPEPTQPIFGAVVHFHPEYSTERGVKYRGAGNISGVSVRDVSVVGGRPVRSAVVGFDAEHRVTGISFERMTVDGMPVREPKDIGLYIGKFVAPPVFR